MDYEVDYETTQKQSDNVDWMYNMRRDMQEIIPGLFLGPYSAAVKTKYNDLMHQQITHIVCVRQSLEAHFIRPNFPDIFKYLVLDLKDSVTEIIIPILPKLSEFINDCFACGGKVLVHGNSGISRSGALVIGYIIENMELSYREALSLVQQKRFCVNPNPGFSRQLQEYEPIYRARKMLQNGHHSQQSGRNKRRILQLDS